MKQKKIIEPAPDALDEPMSSHTDTDILNRLRQCEILMRLVLAKQLQLIAEAERRGLGNEHRVRKAKAFLWQVLRIFDAEAHSRTRVARLACDSEILPMGLGGASPPPDIGRTLRTAPP